MGLRVWASLAAMLAVTAGAAQAADEAGALALESDFNAFFTDLAETLALAVAPAAPVKVVLAGDGYRATIGPLTVTAADPAAEGVVLAVDRLSLDLRPDDIVPSLTLYSARDFPAVRLRVDGATVLEITGTLVSNNGAWLDAIDAPVAEGTVIENLRVQAAPELLPGGVPGLPAGFVLRAGRLETSLTAIDHGRDSWRVDSEVVIDDFGLYAAGVVGVAGVAPDPETGLQAIQHIGRIESQTLMALVPLMAWRDFALNWIRQAGALAGGDTDDPSALLTAFLTELPALPDKIEMRARLDDVATEAIVVQRQEQYLRFTGLASDALSLHQRDYVTGMRPGQSDDPFLARLAPLVPEVYVSDMELRDLPVGHAWRALTDTVDAWINAPGPDAAAEVFFRSFANQALAIGSAVRWDVTLEWPGSRFDLDLDLAVSETAEMTVAGTVDGAFTGMAALGEPLGEAIGPEAALGWAVLEAFGQREQPADGGPSLTRFLVEIGEDGHVTFNGQDYDVVIRMIEGAFASGMDFFEIPTPD